MEQVEVVLAGTPVGACRETALDLAVKPLPLWHGHRGVTGVRPEQLDVLVRGVRLLPEVAPNLDALEVPARADLVAAIADGVGGRRTAVGVALADVVVHVLDV